MHLTELRLTNFKNYDFATLSLLPTINAFCGRNGMGKTNLLDAIYYLCLTKSHFSTSDRYVVRHETDFFRLEGHFAAQAGAETGMLEKVVAKVQPGKSKVMERNGKAYPRLSDHVGFQPVVVTSPNDTVLASGGSEERRRFLDNTLSQIDQTYLQDLVTYNRLLQQRNSLLKMMAKQGRFDRTAVEIYDRQMLVPADAIYQARAQYIMEFTPLVQKTYQAISSRDEVIDCHYRSQLNEASLAHLRAQSLEKDRLLQRTTTGIHRDDLAFTIDGHPLKRFGSQGQLKTFVIALKFAQYLLIEDIRQTPPILLLDDIFDKLDPKRVENLLSWLNAPRGNHQPLGQIFLTDTDLSRLREILPRFRESRIFEVNNGVVSRSS